MTLSFTRKRDDLDAIFANDINELQAALEAHDTSITENIAVIAAHTEDTANPHNVTKAQVGLGNVDNTADIDKPLSTAIQAALDAKADQTTVGTKADQSAVDAVTPNALGQLIAGLSTGTIVRLPMGAVGTSLRPTASGLQYLNLIVIHVDDFGGKGDGIANNDAAIAAAIAAGKILGNSNNLAQGCILAFGPGAYSIRNPIILPRNGNTPNNVVQLVGTGMRSTAIVGHISLFPANRALIEWEATPTRIWHGRIANMRLHVPSITGTKAIWHQPVNPLDTYAHVSGEWMQCDFENILITGNNDYHQVFIDLGVGDRSARIVNVIGDPSVGNGTYDTVLLRTPTDYIGGGVGLNDVMGIGYCVVENLIQTIRSGGYGAAFSGRTYASSWNLVGAPGGRTQASFEFINSWGGTYTNFYNEGRSEPAQIRVVKGVGLDFHKMQLGTPNPAYSGWTANHAYAMGDLVVQTTLLTGASPTSNKVWQCTVVGTSAATEPTWTNSVNDTITDGTVTWQAVRDATGVGISLESGTRDCHFSGRISDNGNNRFSSYLAKVVRISADSQRNTFEHIQIRGAGDGYPSAEVQIDAPVANLNHLSGVDLGSGTTATPYALGWHPHHADVTRLPRTVTISTTLGIAERTNYADATSGALTVTLPTAAGIAGKRYTIKKIDASANVVTITSAATIDGAPTYALSTRWSFIVVESDGINWQIVGKG